MNVQKILVTAAAGGVLAVGLAASSIRYREYQNQELHSSQAQADKAKANQTKAESLQKAKDAERVAQYNKIVVECLKGKTLYDKQITVVKSQTPALQCGFTVTSF